MAGNCRELIEETCAERDRRALLVAHLPRAPTVAEAAAAAEEAIIVVIVNVRVRTCLKMSGGQSVERINTRVAYRKLSTSKCQPNDKKINPNDRLATEISVVWLSFCFDATIFIAERGTRKRIDIGTIQLINSPTLFSISPSNHQDDRISGHITCRCRIFRHCNPRRPTCHSPTSNGLIGPSPKGRSDLPGRL